MQHILLTGATGFLGSHLLGALLLRGYKVTILKRSTSNTWRIDHLLRRVSCFDIDKVPLEKAFCSKKIDIVIHTACSYGRDGSSVDEVINANLLFGLRVLEAAVSAQASVFLNTDTFFNSDTLRSAYLGSYVLSKKHFAEWLEQFDDRIKIVTLKLGHVYGPKDDAKKFVPWLISQLENDVERISLTAGNQIRDFIYVDDVVSAYLFTIDRMECFSSGARFDVGSGALITVREFVEVVCQIYKNHYPKSISQLGFGDISMRDGELLSVLQNDGVLFGLGWNCRFSCESGTLKMMGLSS